MPVFVGAGTSSFMKGDDGVGISTMTTTERNALSGVKKGGNMYELFLIASATASATSSLP